MPEKIVLFLLSFIIFFTGCEKKYQEFRNMDEIVQLEESRQSSEINQLVAIRERIQVIPAFNHSAIHAGWKIGALDSFPDAASNLFCDSTWKAVSVGHKWYENDYAYWFRQKIVIPKEIDGFNTMGKAIILYVRVNDDEQIWIDGKLKQDFGMGDANIQLTHEAVPGETFTIAIQGFNGPGKGELLQVELRIEAVEKLAARLQNMQQRLIRLTKALAKLPEIESRWIKQIDAAIEATQQAVKLRNIVDIQYRFRKLERSIVKLEQNHPDFPAFIIEPYLQHVTQEQATILWETDVPADTEILWGPTTKYDSSRISPKLKIFHQMTLSGLEAEQTIHYRVRSGKLWSKDFTFRTAPRATTLFKFAVWGDSHGGNEITEKLEKLALENGADLLIQPGDAVNHGANPADWVEQFFNPIRHFAAGHPIYLAPGNHEYGGYWDTYQPLLFEKYLFHPGNPYWHSFTFGNAHFIILDPNKGSPPFDIPPDSEQYQWLLAELNSEKFRQAVWHFVIFHQSPFSESWGGGYYDGEAKLRENIVPLMETYPIDIVFTGHTHDYERGRWPRESGPCFIITGGGGGSLDVDHFKDWEQIEFYKHVHHFCLIEIAGKKLKFSARQPDGTVFDAFEMVPRSGLTNLKSELKNE